MTVHECGGCAPPVVSEVKAEPEILELIKAILDNGDFYQQRQKQGDKAIANRFYNLLPAVNELNRKLKELRAKI